jgi:hypothetical protein
VETGRGLKAFIDFPKALFRNDPHWVPPLWSAEREAYKKGGNAVLDRSPHRLFMAYRGDRPVSRLIAYIDPAFNSYFGSRIGFFGCFDTKNDGEAVHLLFAEAEAWLKKEGMETCRGPINPVAECWGLLVEGFDSDPVYLSPYNPPYYGELAFAEGFGKAKDLIVYEADTALGYTVPERFRRFAAAFPARHPAFSVRRLNPRTLGDDAESIRLILNEGVAGNWGFVPVDKEEMALIAKDLKPILDPDAVWFVEKEGKPVACCLGFPDINVLIKRINGRLWPTGIFSLLFGRAGLRGYRLWGLAVLPEYQGMGLDVLMYCKLADALSEKKVRLEANYILEDNFRIKNALDKLEMTKIKTYRVFEKRL